MPTDTSNRSITHALPRRLRVVVLLALAAIGSLALATPAHAAVTLRTCVSQATFKLNPGLTTLSSQHVTIRTDNDEGSLTSCVDQGGVSGLVASYTATENGSESSTCLAQNFRVKLTIKWNNSNTSVVPLESVSTTTANTFAFSGRVDTGELAGNNARLVMTATNAVQYIADCATPGGATSVPMLGAITFTQV
jgi:hypothetical protein